MDTEKKSKKSAPKVPVQEHLSVKIKITNIDEFKKLVTEAIEKLDEIKNFKFSTKVCD
jgi:hypothetical protein